MHKLKMKKDNGYTKIFLDDEEIKHVNSYELSEFAGQPAELTLRIYVAVQNVDLE